MPARRDVPAPSTANDPTAAGITPMRTTRPKASARSTVTLVSALALAPAAGTALPARGQEPAAAKSTTGAAEAPSLFPKGYADHAALSAALRRAAEARPDRVRVEALARSAQGREVWLVTLGTPAPEGARPKPAVLVVANLEADHVVGGQAALGIIERLADPKADLGWLDRVTVYVVPRLNPDGAERVVAQTPAADVRTNLRPIDRDRDGRSGEDGPDDLDGDGVVTRMRVKDPKTATSVVDEKDPRILRKADPAKGERAVYAEEAEGRDDDGDGLRNEDPPGGVNLNRNWPHRWTEFDREAGFSPASEPEVFGLIRFAFAHPEVVAVWSFGLNDNLREEPKKPASTLDDADLPLFAELSRAFAKATAPAEQPPKGTSPAGQGMPAPGATTDGPLSEWAYHQFGAVGLASRLWTTPEVPPAVAEKPAEKEASKGQKEPEKAAGNKTASPQPDTPALTGEARWLAWNDRVMGGRAFVPFKPFDHPALGKVEIGGWRPGVRLNPPAEQVGALAGAHLAFLKDLAGRLPRLSLPEAKAVAKGGGLYEVTATVANEGYFPTALAQGVRTGKAPPVLVRLDAGKAKVLSGRTLERVDTLAGSGGRRSFRWLIQAPEGAASVRIDASCPKAGSAEATVPLR